MAEQKQAVAGEAKGKSMAVKTAIVLAVALVIEGAVAVGGYVMFGGPATAKADSAAKDAAAAAEQPVEIELLKDRFQNTRTGRAYIYDTQIYVVVAQKNATQITAKIKDMQALLTTDVATIVRRADPSYFHEPDLATLTRQIKADLDKRFGKDEDGKAYIEKVLIQQMTEYPLGG